MGWNLLKKEDVPADKAEFAAWLRERALPLAEACENIYAENTRTHQLAGRCLNKLQAVLVTVERELGLIKLPSKGGK